MIDGGTTFWSERNSFRQKANTRVCKVRELNPQVNISILGSLRTVDHSISSVSTSEESTYTRRRPFP